MDNFFCDLETRDARRYKYATTCKYTPLKSKFTLFFHPTSRV